MQSDSEPIKIVTKNNGIQLNNWMMKVGKTNFEYFISILLLTKNNDRKSTIQNGLLERVD